MVLCLDSVVKGRGCLSSGRRGALSFLMTSEDMRGGFAGARGIESEYVGMRKRGEWIPCISTNAGFAPSVLRTRGCCRSRALGAGKGGRLGGWDVGRGMRGCTKVRARRRCEARSGRSLLLSDNSSVRWRIRDMKF